MQVNPVISGSYPSAQAVGSSIGEKSVQAATGDGKNATSQPATGGAGRAGGTPPPKKASSASGTSSTTKVYDKKDLNKDGTVSEMEEIRYDATHPQNVKKTSVSSTADSSKAIDYTA